MSFPVSTFVARGLTVWKWLQNKHTITENGKKIQPFLQQDFAFRLQICWFLKISLTFGS
jgi:hypothetical protein